MNRSQAFLFAAARRLRPARLLLALAFALAVQPFGGALPAAAKQALPFGQGLLWQIETPGRAPSYLFGTMHATDPQVVALPTPVTTALDSAQSLTVEMVTTPDVPRRMAQAMMLQDGRTLDQIIGPRLFAAATAAGAAYGMAPEHLRFYAPWAAMTVFSITPEEFRRMGGGALPLDDALQARAAERGLALHGLESIEEQLAIFEDVPEAEQVALLDMTLREHARLDDWFQRIKRAYLARDTAAIYGLMRSQTAGDDPALIRSFETRLIDDRNVRMAARLTDRLDEGRAFIAVGALHLPGERGLLALLESQGRRVTRVY